MSALRPGDDRFHHSDSSHRWTGGDGRMSPEVWSDLVRAHLDEHRANPVPERRRPAGRGVCGVGGLNAPGRPG